MTKDLAIKMVINHFKNADKHNQLRPGETTLAIKFFIAGFQAMYSMTGSVRLTDADFEAVIDALESHFDQFADS